MKNICRNIPECLGCLSCSRYEFVLYTFNEEVKWRPPWRGCWSSKYRQTLEPSLVRKISSPPLLQSIKEIYAMNVSGHIQRIILKIFYKYFSPVRNRGEFFQMYFHRDRNQFMKVNMSRQRFQICFYKLVSHHWTGPRKHERYIRLKRWIICS